MLESLLVSQMLLWIIILILSVVCFALVRQVGILYERIAPAGALAMNQKLAGGDRAPTVQLTSLDNTALSIGQQTELNAEISQPASSKSQLLFFLSPSCPVCKTLMPILKKIGKDNKASLTIILASDGEDVSTHQAFIKKQCLADFPYVISEPLGLAYGVSKLPYAVLIDEKGFISALGIVNTREHLESLFEAKLLGKPTIQDFLESENINNTTSNSEVEKEGMVYEIR